MTRRDYCQVCSEMVGDHGLFCIDCDRSFCSDCVTPYDEFSRISIIESRILGHDQPEITLFELKQYFNDIQMNFIKDCIKTNNKLKI